MELAFFCDCGYFAHVCCGLKFCFVTEFAFLRVQMVDRYRSVSYRVQAALFERYEGALDVRAVWGAYCRVAHADSFSCSLVEFAHVCSLCEDA